MSMETDQASLDGQLSILQQVRSAAASGRGNPNGYANLVDYIDRQLVGLYRQQAALEAQAAGSTLVVTAEYDAIVAEKAALEVENADLRKQLGIDPKEPVVVVR